MVRGAWEESASAHQHVGGLRPERPGKHSPGFSRASAWVYIFNDPALKGRQKSTRALNVSVSTRGALTIAISRERAKFAATR